MTDSRRMSRESRPGIVACLILLNPLRRCPQTSVPTVGPPAVLLYGFSTLRDSLRGCAGNME